MQLHLSQTEELVPPRLHQEGVEAAEVTTASKAETDSDEKCIAVKCL
jgi:hypothetical protein